MTTEIGEIVPKQSKRARSPSPGHGSIPAKKYRSKATNPTPNTLEAKTEGPPNTSKYMLSSKSNALLRGMEKTGYLDRDPVLAQAVNALRAGSDVSPRVPPE